MREVIVATMWSPSHKELADISWPLIGEYCERHGYRRVAINPEDGDVWYKKHEAFESLFNLAGEDGLIWYMDVDTVITNMTKKVEDFVDDHYPFFITKDFNELNGGSIILKCNEAGRLLNKTVLEQKGTLPNEQNVFNSMPFLTLGSDFMKILPQHTINSYEYSLYHECKEYVGRHDLGDWESGDLLIHFPGIGIKDRVELMKEYAQKIIK